MSEAQRSFPARTASIAEAVRWACKDLPADVEPELVSLGLTEAVTNAVVHGVLGVDSKAREEDYDAYLRQIPAVRNKVPEPLPPAQAVN